MSKKLTPLMEQYWAIKNDHLDKVLLFRMGDFFEMFHDDAVRAAPILEIALTQRNKKSEDDTPMCGVPHHSIAGPIAKLLAAGLKVAICDQVEDPKEAKGIVKRAVTRILSPGMVYDPETLDPHTANYLCSFNDSHVAFFDSTTAEAFYYSYSNVSELHHLVTLLAPTEVVLPTSKEALNLPVSSYISRQDSLDGVPKKFQREVEPVQRLLSYLVYMQGDQILSSVQGFELRHLQKKLRLSPTVIRHLEVFKTYKGEKVGTLFFSVDRTKTSGGARLLKNWLRIPLADMEQIEERLNRVERWVKDPTALKELRKILANMGDVERRLGKIAQPNCNPRDLLALAESLRTGILLEPLCQDLNIPVHCMNSARRVVSEIETTIEEDAPLSFKMGGVVCRGLNAELDELIKYAEESQSLLLSMENRERERTGISSLKIRYNSVFGYYIEVTKTHTNKVPDHYKRKQTLSNAERYLTQELHELEEKVLSARSKRIELEEKIFSQLKHNILQVSAELLVLAHKWAELDVASALAWLALEKNYQRPNFSVAGDLRLEASRHPVVEQTVDRPFVPNSLNLKAGECLLLTGPNMAGKSTLMRQVAVISLLAQVGSYVPAQFCQLPVFTNIFTRVGASDYLSEGLSTFMVEMQEAAEMLKSATDNSLVILDEVGRGTSTYDGMSLAQAILEFLVTECGCITLFATHYHELTQLAQTHSRIHNAHMAIREQKGEIQFLHTLANGPANKSYGIQVARLAGLPSSVTRRAQQVLSQLERQPHTNSFQLSLLDMDNTANFVEDKSDQRITSEEKELLAEVKDVSVQNLTPLEALNKLAIWQKRLN